MKFLILSLAVTASGVSAQTLREGDTVLNDRQMAALSGVRHVFFDGGTSFFSETDRYTYTYPDGGVAHGRYEIRIDGQVCTSFTHGFERCDTYVQSGSRLVLITEDGTRFPVREVN